VTLSTRGPCSSRSAAEALDEHPTGLEAYKPSEMACRVHGSSGIEDPNAELAFWDTVRGSHDPAMMRAYLEKYPDGEFRSLAEIMLADSAKAR